ncbi:MAG: Deoxyguanosine kinase [Anaerolineae bacterium]|nr:Deoxyguanosine kinase [Anaerolineae bacterium]MDL1897028.1 deoxynucleoside kinase [Anaerolineae bacterium CFX7]
MKPAHFYIAIEGVIGVGKTTLARLLRDRFDAALLLEVFEENPFLARFYQDRERYAFQTQTFFLLSRYQQQHEAIPHALATQNLFSDYTFDKNKIFARLTLSGDELEMYERVQDTLGARIPLPNLVVYLRAEVECLMTRIAARDRSYERTMEREYIAALAQAYDAYFNAYHASPVLKIETTELDIVRQPQDVERIAELIRAKMAETPIQARWL